MKHERVYYTCEGCGNELPDEDNEMGEGHTEVRAVYTGHRDETPNDGKVWELCATCWLDVFAVLDRQDHKRRQAREAQERAYRSETSLRHADTFGDLRPWDDL